MNYLQIYRNEVEAEFESAINELRSFFINNGFNKDQSEELTKSLNKALYHIKRDKKERIELEKKVISIFRSEKKIEIEDLENLIGLKSLLKKQTGNNDLFYKSVRDLIVAKVKLKAIPRSGSNILFRLSLTPLFWKLNELGKGQSEQIDVAYDLFKYYELDDYGTESEINGTFVGETEQKDRIRTQFQQPAMKYWD